MTSQAHKKRKILFVDDEPAFLEMIQRAASQWGRDIWDVHLADSAGKALSIIQDQAIDLVIIDVQMPVVDGVQFLSLLHRKFPNLQKVVLTGFANDTYRAQCLSGGAELFLEKPRTPEGMESIFATLHELARWQPEEGFRGVMRRMGLPDIVQMECLSRHSVVLEVTTAGVRGEIFIKDGAIIHAQMASTTGETALNQLLGLSGGEFNLRHYSEPRDHTIEGSWEFLLMEAARKQDEAGVTGQSDGGSAVAAASAPMPPVLSRVTGEAKSATMVRRDASRESVSPPPREGAAARSRTQIDEVMVCTTQGDVLYEYKCGDASKRIQLLEFVSKKARQLAQGLPLGAMDRLELATAKNHIVIQIRDDHGLMVRASQCAGGALSLAKS